MSFENALDLEKEIYAENFQIGYKEGSQKAKLIKQEDYMGEGIEVIIIVDLIIIKKKIGLKIGYYIGYMNLVKNLVYEKMKEIESENGSSVLVEENKSKLLSKFENFYFVNC